MTPIRDFVIFVLICVIAVAIQALAPHVAILFGG